MPLSKEISNKISEEIQCKLLAETLIESKAKRVFYIFKPREVVVDENYKLGLTLTNEGDTVFDEGKIEVQLSYMIGEKELQLDLKQSIPIIASKQSKNIYFQTQKAETSGKAILRVMNIIPKNEKVKIACYNISRENLLDRQNDNVLTFSIASREEIYQRYSVLVALFFSIIAMVLSIINAIASIITLLR